MPKYPNVFDTFEEPRLAKKVEEYDKYVKEMKKKYGKNSREKIKSFTYFIQLMS